MFPVSVLADYEVLPMVKAEVIQPRDVVRAREANIVAVTGTALARIPQTNYEFH